MILLRVHFILNSLRKCGIIPFNKNFLGDEDFDVEDFSYDISNASFAVKYYSVGTL